MSRVLRSRKKPPPPPPVEMEPSTPAKDVEATANHNPKKKRDNHHHQEEQGEGGGLVLRRRSARLSLNNPPPPSNNNNNPYNAAAVVIGGKRRKAAPIQQQDEEEESRPLFHTPPPSHPNNDSSSAAAIAKLLLQQQNNSNKGIPSQANTSNEGLLLLPPQHMDAIIEDKGKGILTVPVDTDEQPTATPLPPATLTLLQESTVNPANKMDPKERFKNVAKENASKFAHFSIPQPPPHPHPLEDEDEDEDEPHPLLHMEESHADVEDWPGPFSTAMKIIKDRSSTEPKNKPHSAPLVWLPNKNNNHDRFIKVPPSLEELCMDIMAQNVDAITSLDNVPDVLRHKLTHALCDSRKMNHHFLNLLASSSPSEIRVKDCSWLDEDHFTKTFQAIDASNLAVLQLDQCGRCLPDYVLYATLNHLPKNLSALTNISLKGACRLSDAGLNALVTSASSLRSINLGCCSLLTSDAIINLADNLGSVLKELYIDECFGIDAKSILPALFKLQHLEVLSISRSETVNDSFITQFVAVQGHKMKELGLADCTKLTDRALKSIATNCPGLSAIDLTNVCKLTDTSLGHLANGCQTIQALKFCRNTFSDEAVAAYLEARGGPLTDLSLNHVDKVANHTALSLAKHAKKLQCLDVSWCREMTDEGLGLIVDSCLSLKMLKVFGCTQITSVFTHGHSNESVKIVGLQESQILKNIVAPDLHLPLRYSSV